MRRYGLHALAAAAWADPDPTAPTRDASLDGAALPRTLTPPQVPRSNASYLYLRSRDTQVRHAVAYLYYPYGSSTYNLVAAATASTPTPPGTYDLLYSHNLSSSDTPTASRQPNDPFPLRRAHPPRVRNRPLSDAPPPLGGRDLRGWRRRRCGGCGLPDALCLCAELPALAVRTRVVVVMHRIEALRSTNTGRLAARMLSGATVRVRGDREVPTEPAPVGRRLVLFPLEGARPLARGDAGDDLVLVVPDGTWSQARRIHRRDPASRGAETVTLPAQGPSAYDLRRGVREGGVCTLEAIAAALGVLEGEAVEAALRGAFAAWRERAVKVRRGAEMP